MSEEVKMVPENLVIHQASRVLALSYANGEAFDIPIELMRVYSPSAEVRGHGPGQEVLQSGKRNVTIVSVQPVGNYAIQPTFSDGHDSGLFSWDYLYQMGKTQAELWEAYEARLSAAGRDRDDPMPPEQQGKACGS
jgi:DUF971 family protein